MNSEFNKNEFVNAKRLVRNSQYTQKQWKFKRTRKLEKGVKQSSVGLPIITEFQELECSQNVTSLSIGIIKIIDTLAIGRCCEVYIGEELRTSVKRAVKVFIRHQNYRGALARELKFLKILTPHPHIVLPIENVHYEGKDILIHELLSKTLKDIMLIHYKGTTNPSEWLVTSLGKHLLSGLCHMHNHGIVHGDLKPQNIMWCGYGECFKLIDFGVSFRISENIRHSIQSIAYQAPETTRWNKSVQLPPSVTPSDLQPGPPADIWSAGVIVLELICGRKLFHNGWSGEDVKTALKDAMGPMEKIHQPAFLLKATSFLERAMNCDGKERASAEELLVDPFLKELSFRPKLFDLSLLPTLVLRLLTLITPETKPYKDEIVAEILGKIKMYHPLEHSISETTGSLYVLFASVDNSTSALQMLSNTSIKGYTIVPTFFPSDSWKK